MSTRKDFLQLPLTRHEIECILSWREDVFWPEERQLLKKLERAVESGEQPKVSKVLLKVLWAWAEEEMGGHLGRPVRNTELRAIAAKLEPLLQ
ncbi:MAG: hypothetical protein CME28_07670 [Gemmatimonadetes bacterium]|nr:hypothetical protein [Gemmatimonadota bacterium]